MKMFNKKNNNKSWAITLSEIDDNVRILACDSVTGKEICSLITFFADGDVYLQDDAKEYLFDNGYDPKEHNNDFDESGRIIIKKGE